MHLVSFCCISCAGDLKIKNNLSSTELKSLPVEGFILSNIEDVVTEFYIVNCLDWVSH